MNLGALSHIPGLWLDVTRTLSRLGRGAPTGIDRVEHRYLKAILDAGGQRFLCRSTRGYLLLDAAGAQRLLDLVEGKRALGQADLLSRLTFRGKRPRHQAEAAIRSVALDRCTVRGLRVLLDRNAAGPPTLINVGHANLSEATLSAFSTAGRTIVMIHDLIPITHPDLVADRQPQNFAGRIERVRQYADHVITNSGETAKALKAHWQDADHIPEVTIAHLGLDQSGALPRARDPLHFVMLGTIEPRKNHALMVDVWEALAKGRGEDQMPDLHIIGSAGWKVDELMARLNNHPLLGRSIHLHGALSDQAVAAHLAKANALLFPSLVEGFGFPPLEAVREGAVPVCHDLPVLRETLGDCVVYVNNLKAYHWIETIEQLIDGTTELPDLTTVKIPTWQEHFEIVAQAVIASNVKDRP